MEQSASQLVAFIDQSLAGGMTEANIRYQLVQNGWPPVMIETAFHQARSGLQSSPRPLYSNEQEVMASQSLPRPVKPHNIRNGVLWILSPFILLVSIAILQLIIHYTFGLNTSASSSPIWTAVKILSVLGGILGVILVPVGPIIGIIKLT